MTRGRTTTTRCPSPGGGAVVGNNGKGTVIISTVRSDDRKQGIKNSKVVLIGPAPSVGRRSEKTDAQGNACFKDLEPGSYSFKHELPDSFLVSMEHSADVSVSANGHAMGVAKAFATGTLKIRVVDALTKALIPVCTVHTTAAPQAITWAAQGGGEQSFASIAPGRYEATASADPALYDALLNGRTPTGSASVIGGGTGVLTIELMPRSWISFSFEDTLRKRPVQKATIKLQPSGSAAPQSGATVGEEALKFWFTKASKHCTVVDVTVDDDELYEVTGVEAA